MDSPPGLWMSSLVSAASVPSRPLELDHTAILRDRRCGHSLGLLARNYRVSRTTIHRVLREHTATTMEKTA